MLTVMVKSTTEVRSDKKSLRKPCSDFRFLHALYYRVRQGENASLIAIVLILTTSLNRR